MPCQLSDHFPICPVKLVTDWPAALTHCYFPKGKLRRVPSLGRHDEHHLMLRKTQWRGEKMNGGMEQGRKGQMGSEFLSFPLERGPRPPLVLHQLKPKHRLLTLPTPLQAIGPSLFHKCGITCLHSCVALARRQEDSLALEF